MSRDFVINRVASNGDINEEVFYVKCGFRLIYDLLGH